MMSSKQYTWLSIIVLLFVALLLDVHHSYAQATDSADGEEVVSRQHFTVYPPQEGLRAANATAEPCTITADLRWYRKMRVKVLYQWQGCPAAYTVHWELVSIRSANGAMTTTASEGAMQVYNATWPELAGGDLLTLHTSINGQPQADVVTKFRDNAPVWVRLHTRSDSAGACFRFTGHNDPWGNFSVGDQAYQFELSNKDWETPWLAAPNQPTVDWHAALYRDAAMTELRSEYWFNNVENPCYTPEPPSCDGVALSLPTALPLPVAGAELQVQVTGQRATLYRIVDESDAVVAGPDASATLNFHVLPAVTYQAQVKNEGTSWTKSGCTFRYQIEEIAFCNGLTLSVADRATIPATGSDVTVGVNAQGANFFQLVDLTRRQAVVGPDRTAVFVFHATPLHDYQVQVSSDGNKWSTAGCTFSYVTPPPPPVACNAVALSIPDGSIIPTTGAAIDATVLAEDATEYQIIDQTSGDIVAGPSANANFALTVLPFVHYQAQVKNDDYAWTKAGCFFGYTAEPQVPQCVAVQTNPATDVAMPEGGADVTVAITAHNAKTYQIIEQATGKIMDGPSDQVNFQFHALPQVRYQAQAKNSDSEWTTTGCLFEYPVMPPPSCDGVELSVPNGSKIPASGVEVTVTINGKNGSLYRIMADGVLLTTESTSNVFTIHATPGINYQAQVYSDGFGWSESGCLFRYNIVETGTPECIRVLADVGDVAKIPMTGANIGVAISSFNATEFRILDEHGTVMAGPDRRDTFQFHAMPKMRYHAEVRNAEHEWITASACSFGFDPAAVIQPVCSLRAEHYGDPGGRSIIEGWLEDEEGNVQVAPTVIERVVVNWDNHGTISYPTATQAGPWATNDSFTLDSRPEVHDVGFGYYRFEAWVYMAGIDTPAYCQGDGNAPDHDNVIPDPGPFAKDNAEGKFVRSNTPSRLPIVGRLPFDAGNGPDKVELILWAFEKEGNGISARITGIANEGKPLARLGMASVSDFVKFDGLPAREGIVYGFQISEHGPWSPLFCPKPDSNPTTITVFWGAGGQTWLSDWEAYGDCWWLTTAAALQGWVTVDESVAAYNALQGVIDWNGHKNLVFSLAQDRATGMGPRMQDAVVGLQAREWQGPVVPQTVPADFVQVVDGYQEGK